MKKYLSILFVVLVFFPSCKKMLEENPKSILNPDQFFNSDGEAIAAVNGAYSTCYTIFGDGIANDIGYWSALGTDIARPTSGTANFHFYTLSGADEGNLGDMWILLYKGVANCNLVISGVVDNAKITPATAAETLGQAYFLRAMYYYWLTCLWGDVPMWLDALDIATISGPLERTPVSTIRQQMISDLKKAIPGLPANWTGANQGRASRWAAGMLLTKYLLWEEDWTAAAAAAETVIEQQDGPHHLLPDYGDIWGTANEYNAENIWEIDFTMNTHQTAFSDRYMPRQVDEPAVPGYSLTGYGLVTASVEFLASFDAQDKRAKWYNWNGANGVTTNYHYVLKMMTWGEPRGNHGLNSLVYRLADAYLMAAEAANEANGPTTLAYNRINAIRERAGLPALSGLSQEAFRQAIRNERKWELSFEFQRRWDLNRWGILPEAVQSNATTNPTGAANVKAHHRLCPIPIRERSLNPALTQNSGY